MNVTLADILTWLAICGVALLFIGAWAEYIYTTLHHRKGRK